MAVSVGISKECIPIEIRARSFGGDGGGRHSKPTGKTKWECWVWNGKERTPPERSFASLNYTEPTGYESVGLCQEKRSYLSCAGLL